MKKLSSLLLLAFTTGAFAQSNFIEIRGGASLTSMTSSNKNLYWPKYATNFTGGFSFGHKFNNRFFVCTDVLYNRFGFKDAYKLTISDNSSEKVSYLSINYNYDYLAVPITAGYAFGNTFFCQVKLGLVPSFLIEANSTTQTSDANRTPTSSTTERITAKTNWFDFGAIGAVGLGYKLNNNIALISDIAFRKSFTSTPNANDFITRQIQHYGFTATLGLRYTLKRD